MVTETGFGPVGYVESSQARYPVFTRQLAQIRAAQVPEIGAHAAVVLDGESDTVLFARNADERLPMASMTKMMTAVLAIESGRLNEVITVDVNWEDYPDSSLMGLRPGELLTLEELLYGLLLPSGNDAAIAIARAVAGSEEQFVAAMNRRAAELGLHNTHFANPHGLDHPDHYSSATDMARLARYAMRFPVFATIVGTREHTIQGKWVYQLRNTNRLLGTRPEVRGVKTGSTEAAGSCLTALATRDGHQLFVVVMNSPDYVEDTSRLIDHFFGHTAWLRVEPPMSPFYHVADPSPTPTTIVLPRWQQTLVRSDVVDDAPLSVQLSIDGAVLGRIRLSPNGRSPE